jgi:predicted metal-dependent hydrolase
LNFSAELPDLKPVLWDDAIVHELLHFAIPAHGKLWKSLMRPHPVDYEVPEGQLQH